MRVKTLCSCPGARSAVIRNAVRRVGWTFLRSVERTVYACPEVARIRTLRNGGTPRTVRRAGKKASTASTVSTVYARLGIRHTSAGTVVSSAIIHTPETLGARAGRTPRTPFGCASPRRAGRSNLNALHLVGCRASSAIIGIPCVILAAVGTCRGGVPAPSIGGAGADLTRPDALCVTGVTEVTVPCGMVG